MDGTPRRPLEFGSRCLGSDKKVRNHTENPGRKEHRDVAEVRNVNLPFVTRKYTGNDQVVRASDQREKAHPWSARPRAVETRKERRIGSKLATNA